MKSKLALQYVFFFNFYPATTKNMVALLISFKGEFKSFAIGIFNDSSVDITIN